MKILKGVCLVDRALYLLLNKCAALVCIATFVLVSSFCRSVKSVCMKNASFAWVPLLTGTEYSVEI